MPIFNPQLQALSTSEVQRYAGMHKPTDFPTSAISSAMREGRLLAAAKASWEIYPYDAEKGIIEAHQPLKLQGQSILQHLSGSSKIAVLCVTIGTQLEDASNSHFNASAYTHALLLDAVGTTAVEAAADHLNVFLCREALQKGYICTSRFSPGYGDWDITVQPEILRLAKAELVNIMSTESCMLLPRKSVTAVIGLKANRATETQLATKHHCRNCSLHNCLARQKNGKDE